MEEGGGRLSPAYPPFPAPRHEVSMEDKVVGYAIRVQELNPPWGFTIWSFNNIEALKKIEGSW